MMRRVLLFCAFLSLSACAARQTPAPITNDDDIVTTQSKVLDYSKPAGENVLSQRRFYFGLNRTTLNEHDIAVLKAQAEYLKQHPTIHLVLMGYSDPLGNSSYNHVLAKRRAQAVANQLIKAGVSKDRILVVAYGVTNQAGVPRTSDRRVDLIYGG